MKLIRDTRRQEENSMRPNSGHGRPENYAAFFWDQDGKQMIREWYFVRKLDSSERPDRRERFEVQVVDEDGRGEEVGYLAEDTTSLVIGGRAIPSAVIKSAKARVEGQGEYVGPDGQPLPPFQA